MQSFIWAIGSLLILVPIIYFLPLGISSRGKWIVISISFILGLMGLLAKDVLPLWKISLMFVLLLGIIAYFIEKKYGRELFITANIPGIEEEAPKENEMKATKVRERNTESSSKIDEFEPLEDDLSISSKDNYTNVINTETDFPDVTYSNKQVSDIEEIQIEEIQIDEIQDEIQVELQDDYFTLNKDKDEDEEFLAMEIFDLESSDAANDDNHIEKEETDEIFIDSSVPDLDNVMDEEDQLAEEIFDLKTLNDENRNNIEVEMGEVDEVIGTPTPEEVVVDKNEDEINTLDFSEIEITSIEVEKDANTNDQHKIPKEMLYSMIAQLEITNKSSDAHEYAQLIKDHMHERLTVHEYYTFASLLIEHYIRLKQFDELEKLIDTLRNKVKGYPILEQETEFIYNRYCEKLQ